MQRKRDISTRLGMTTTLAIMLASLIVAGASLMAIAIKDPSLWWLGWFTLIPLFISIRVSRPGLAGAFGALWGGSLFAFGILYTGTMSASLVALAALMVVPGFYGYFSARLTRHVGFSPYLLALGWIGVEVALGPFGLRHGLLAATQGDGALVHAFGSFAGYALVAFAVAYINAAFVSALEEVKAAAGGTRFAPRSTPAAALVGIYDDFCVRIHLLRPAQARAPPVE